MALFNKKTYVITAKTWRKKIIKNTQLFLQVRN